MIQFLVVVLNCCYLYISILNESIFKIVSSVRCITPSPFQFQHPLPFLPRLYALWVANHRLFHWWDWEWTFDNSMFLENEKNSVHVAKGQGRRSRGSEGSMDSQCKVSLGITLPFNFMPCSILVTKISNSTCGQPTSRQPLDCFGQLGAVRS